tara:strand:+ start:2456 stop:2635 length:180 start_codon:yes stop_codon:yes gene_type:complete
MNEAIEELKIAIEMAEKARHNKMIFQLEKVLNYMKGYELGMQNFAEQLRTCRRYVDGED